LRGSSNVETETNEPNSEEESEAVREWTIGLDVEGSLESNNEVGVGDAGGVGGENKVANKSSVSSAFELDLRGVGI
jgi:hypothetical protein